MSNRMYYSSEAEARARRERVLLAAVSALVGAVVGAILGVVLTVLLSPLRSEDTFSNIADAATDTVEGGRHATSKAIDTLQKNVEDLRNRLEKLIKD